MCNRTQILHLHCSHITATTASPKCTHPSNICMRRNAIQPDPSLCSECEKKAQPPRQGFNNKRENAASGIMVDTSAQPREAQVA